MAATDEMSSPSMASQVYMDLKRDIIRCVYAPGDTLHEPVLAAKHGVSKTPVREALNMLRQEGYVVAQPRRGYLVSPISLRDVLEIFELRLIIEPQAVRMAAIRIDDEQLAQLRTLVQSAVGTGADDDYSRFLENNVRFHTMVAAASGNAKLTATVKRLFEQMERFFHLGQDVRDLDGGVYVDHKDLVDALEERDPDKAEQILRDELERSQARVIDALVGHTGNGGLGAISVR